MSARSRRAAEINLNTDVGGQPYKGRYALMSNKSGLKLILLALGYVLLEAGCAQLKDLASLRDQLIKQYHQQNVEVKLTNGNALNIKFINSEFNALGAEQKEAKAREIANFVKGHCASIDGVETVGIAFVTRNNYVVIIKETEDKYDFRKSEID